MKRRKFLLEAGCSSVVCNLSWFDAQGKESAKSLEKYYISRNKNTGSLCAFRYETVSHEWQLAFQLNHGSVLASKIQNSFVSFSQDDIIDSVIVADSDASPHVVVIQRNHENILSGYLLCSNMKAGHFELMCVLPTEKLTAGMGYFFSIRPFSEEFLYTLGFMDSHWNFQLMSFCSQTQTWTANCSYSLDDWGALSSVGWIGQKDSPFQTDNLVLVFQDGSQAFYEFREDDQGNFFLQERAALCNGASLQCSHGFKTFYGPVTQSEIFYHSKTKDFQERVEFPSWYCGPFQYDYAPENSGLLYQTDTGYFILGFNNTVSEVVREFSFSDVFDENKFLLSQVITVENALGKRKNVFFVKRREGFFVIEVQGAGTNVIPVFFPQQDYDEVDFLKPMTINSLPFTEFPQHLQKNIKTLESDFYFSVELTIQLSSHQTWTCFATGLCSSEKNKIDLIGLSFLEKCPPALRMQPDSQSGSAVVQTEFLALSRLQNQLRTKFASPKVLAALKGNHPDWSSHLSWFLNLPEFYAGQKEVIHLVDCQMQRLENKERSFHWLFDDGVVIQKTPPFQNGYSIHGLRYILEGKYRPVHKETQQYLKATDIIRTLREIRDDLYSHDRKPNERDEMIDDLISTFRACEIAYHITHLSGDMQGCLGASLSIRLLHWSQGWNLYENN